MNLTLKLALQHMIGAGDLMHLAYMPSHTIRRFVTLEERIEKTEPLAAIGVQVVRVK